MKNGTEKQTVRQEREQSHEEWTTRSATPHGTYEEERRGLLEIWSRTADLVAKYHSNENLSAIICNTIQDLSKQVQESGAKRENLTDLLPTLRILLRCAPATSPERN